MLLMLRYSVKNTFLKFSAFFRDTFRKTRNIPLVCVVGILVAYLCQKEWSVVVYGVFCMYYMMLWRLSEFVVMLVARSIESGLCFFLIVVVSSV